MCRAGDDLGRGRLSNALYAEAAGQFSNGELLDEAPGTIAGRIYDEDCLTDIVR